MTITLESISKIYTRKTALLHINTTFSGGAIHSIVGENGAGKSTLAKILCGDISPTNGKILLDGQPVTLKNQHDAIKLGIVTVRQRPLLADSITVQENIFLGSDVFEKKQNFLDHLHTLHQKWAPQLTLSSFVYNIGGDDRFYTALLSALCRNPKVLLLDEPTSLLNDNQRITLYTNLRDLARTGVNIIIITHSMDEATNYSDTVTVLEKGTIQAFYSNSKAFNKGSPGYITFDTLKDPITAPSHKNAEFDQKTEKKLSFSHITVKPLKRPALSDISFSVTKGQLILIQGLTEDGLDTLEHLVTGMEESPCKGSVRCGTTTINLAQKPLTPRILRDRSGICAAIIPSNRTFRGSNPHLTVEQIASVYTSAQQAHVHAQELIKKANIIITPEELGANLSGGMLQRLIIERELATNPDFLILTEPLQGIDSKRAGDIYNRLVSLVHRGTGVLVLTTADFPTSQCDAIYKLHRGKLTLERTHHEI
ncbi:MAG: ATP-binding cassette domain-containing protein [Treponema sp.]|nr:ATP-binding cassette domain-containing protein [Treponema sp.]